MNWFQKSDGLLIIDVQKDFCPGGALAVEEGDKIIPVLTATSASNRMAAPGHRTVFRTVTAPNSILRCACRMMSSR